MEVKVSGLMNGEVIIETKRMPIVCLTCGKKLGVWEIIPKGSVWKVTDTMTICRDCFAKSGLKVMENIPFPY